MNSDVKKILIGILIAIAIYFFFKATIQSRDSVVNQKPASYEPDTSRTLSSTSSDTPTYVSVIVFKGNGRKKSKVFHLSGGDAKIVYKYRSMMENMGVFGVYIVDKGDDIMKTGGIPELSSNQSSDSGESTIQKEAGDYYIDVNAAGSWTVKVEELK